MEIWTLIFDGSCLKIKETLFQFGVYKKKQTSLTPVPNISTPKLDLWHFKIPMYKIQELHWPPCSDFSFFGDVFGFLSFRTFQNFMDSNFWNFGSSGNVAEFVEFSEYIEITKVSECSMSVRCLNFVNFLHFGNFLTFPEYSKLSGFFPELIAFLNTLIFVHGWLFGFFYFVCVFWFRTCVELSSCLYFPCFWISTYF